MTKSLTWSCPHMPTLSLTKSTSLTLDVVSAYGLFVFRAQVKCSRCQTRYRIYRLLSMYENCVSSSCEFCFSMRGAWCLLWLSRRKHADLPSAQSTWSSVCKAAAVNCHGNKLRTVGVRMTFNISAAVYLVLLKKDYVFRVLTEIRSACLYMKLIKLHFKELMYRTLVSWSQCAHLPLIIIIIIIRHFTTHNNLSQRCAQRPKQILFI